MNNYIVFDCETGGLDPKVNPITEIAFIAFQGEDFKEIGRYEAFCQPYGENPKYEPKALELTGITMDMINQGKDHKTFVREIIAFITSSKKRGRLKPVLIAHNAQFDQGMIEECFRVAGKNIYDYVERIFFDTAHLSRLKDPDKKKHNLATACERFGIEIVNAHRAMDDVEATYQMFTQYFGLVRSGNQHDLFSDIQPGEIVAGSAFREEFKF